MPRIPKHGLWAEKKWNEGREAGKHRDMGIKTAAGQDTEGHVRGSKQSEFSERPHRSGSAAKMMRIATSATHAKKAATRFSPEQNTEDPGAF
ncbi:hypothetical protein EPD60_10715 [Flaviaesturariibacter flavus]|uniref:Uncharacterized protein n=1 Tax=Flaviaesturariibacter flavus TaxID=2502780 RepID=A0A4R1BBU1_9BACT|nr:hypothetical protein [Flaviaesturariibacter flavus]TCJ14454.1 hypothetical protein EPD60_10715 [Flaviaesturariibacter flavus]